MTLGSANSVDLTTLLGYTRFLAGTLNNTSQFSDAQITALLNHAQKNLQALILRKMKFGFEENATAGTGTGAIALVAGTNNYAFPTDMLTIDRIDINYTGDDNNWRKANPYPKEIIPTGLENYKNYSSLGGSQACPRYWTYNEKIYIDIVPDQAVTGGLMVWFTSTVSDLSTSTDEPLHVEFSDDIICFEAAMEYKYTKKMMEDADRLKREKLEREAAVVEFYANRDQSTQQKMAVKQRNFR